MCIRDRFEVTKDKAQQFKVLSALMKDKRVTELVCATDAGREGELIFRLVYYKAGCTKPCLLYTSYKTVAFVWVKQNRRNDDLLTGMGSWTRANAEICILATKGHPCLLYTSPCRGAIV